MAVAVAAGAFGAHALRARLDARSLELWETAARYLVIAAVGLLATGLVGPSKARSAAAWSLGLGGLVFSGTVGALALGGPRMLGAITPLGGLGLIGGYVLLAVALARSA
jgi:uncharacterized membrane protein YgdD (TMEM256/DUF423 family)